METFSLKEYVTTALVEICEAVEAARKAHDYIAPIIIVEPTSSEKATTVNFDIAVTVTDMASSETGASGKVGGGLKIGIFRAEADIGSEEMSGEERARSEVSRIQFGVPVYFQYDKEERARRIAHQKRKNRAPKKPIVGGRRK